MNQQNDFQQPQAPKKTRKRRSLEERIAALETEIETKRVDLAELKKKKAAQDKAEKEKAAQKIVAGVAQVEGVDKLSAEEIQQALKDALEKKKLF